MISDNAKVVMGSVFGFGAVLTYHMVDYEPSPEMQTILDELVAANLLVMESGMDDMTAKAVRYHVAEGVDVIKYRLVAWEAMESDSAPQVRVFVKK